jgi:hypothetical protein
MAYYGTVNTADAYFALRLHSDVWDQATNTNKIKALTQATYIIEQFDYKGAKAAVYDVLYDSDGNRILEDPPTEDEIIAADLTQALVFPRGKDTTVPDPVLRACYEIAYALLDGFDPDEAAEDARVIRQTYSSVGTTYADGDLSSEYLLYGIPNGTVWRLLLPYMVDSRSIKLRRVN